LLVFFAGEEYEKVSANLCSGNFCYDDVRWRDNYQLHSVGLGTKSVSSIHYAANQCAMGR
jgi:hypothetical protein